MRNFTFPLLVSTIFLPTLAKADPAADAIARVTVSVEKPTPGRVVYKYTVAAVGLYPLNVFYLGDDQNAPDPENGQEFAYANDAEQPPILKNPKGWKGSVVNTEESLKYVIKWEPRNNPAKPDGITPVDQILPGMKVVFRLEVPAENPMFLNCHWWVNTHKGIFSSAVIPQQP